MSWGLGVFYFFLLEVIISPDLLPQLFPDAAFKSQWDKSKGRPWVGWDLEQLLQLEATQDPRDPIER